jgi:hypothetical protein
MRYALFSITLVPGVMFGASKCAPPAGAVTKLKAYLSYESSVGAGNSGVESFSFAMAGKDALFLQNKPPQYYNEAQRPVYIFRKGSPLFASVCPIGALWATCAETRFRESVHEPTNTIERLGPECDFEVIIPEWHSSPGSPFKKQVASEVLKELMEFGYVAPKEVFVRDFNVNDPELDFYIIDANGEQEVQGCTFDAYDLPHCRWHRFGQSSVPELKRRITARPYRLLPPG